MVGVGYDFGHDCTHRKSSGNAGLLLFCSDAYCILCIHQMDCGILSTVLCIDLGGLDPDFSRFGGVVLVC